jgi:predicted ester cyclase
MLGSRNEEHETVLIRWFEELWNKKNYDVITELAHEEYLDHGDGSQDDSLSLYEADTRSKRGPQAAVEVVKTWLTAFPDGRMTLDEIYSEGDRSVYRTTFHGTLDGPFAGFPANGKKVAVTSTGICRIVCGKVLESWGDFNVVDAMQQIGALPK